MALGLQNVSKKASHETPSRHEDFGRWSCLANEPNLTLGDNETQEWRTKHIEA